VAVLSQNKKIQVFVLKIFNNIQLYTYTISNNVVRKKLISLYITTHLKRDI